MHGNPRSEHDELRLAAEVFLRGPVPVGTRPGGRIEIGEAAVAQVASQLAACDAADVSDIRAALDWYRRLGTTASRQVLIDAVAAAVAVPRTAATRRGRWATDRQEMDPTSR